MSDDFNLEPILDSLPLFIDLVVFSHFQLPCQEQLTLTSSTSWKLVNSFASNDCVRSFVVLKANKETFDFDKYN